MSRLKFKYVLPILIVVISVCIYLYTAAPFMLFEDAPRFLAAIVTLGVGEPAEPVYVFLAHFFTYLPFGSVVFRVQLLSALFAGGSLILLFRLVTHILAIPIHIPQHLTKKQLKKLRKSFHQHPELSQQRFSLPNEKTVLFAGTFSMLILGFSYEFWSQAQNIETFTLCSFITLVVLNLVMTRISYENVFKISALVAFICGVSTATDPPVIATIFPTVLLVIWSWRKALGIKRVIFLCTLGLSGALLGWSYLFFGADRQLILNRENFSTLQGMWDVATGHGLNVYSPSTRVINGITLAPDIMLENAFYYFVMLWLDFTPVILPFIVLGAVFLWRRHRSLLLLLALVPLTNFGLSVIYNSGNIEAWYLQSDIIFAVFSGLGFVWLAKLISTRLKRIPPRLILAVLLCFAFIPLFYWWNTLDRHKWNLTQDYIENLYTPLQGPGILIGAGDLWDSTADYVYDATSYKHNIIPIWGNGLFIFEWQRKQLASSNHIRIPDTSYLSYGGPLSYSKFMNDFFAENINRYHIYLTGSGLKETAGIKGPDTPGLSVDTNRFYIIPEGMVQEVVPKNAKHTPYDLNTKNFDSHFHNGFPQAQPYFLEDSYNGELQSILNEMALSYDNAGTYFQLIGQNDNAKNYYQKAYSLINSGPRKGESSPGVASYKAQIIADLGLFYARQHHPGEALMYFTQAHINEPDNPTWIYDMAQAEGQLGHPDLKNKYLSELKNLLPQLTGSLVKPVINPSNASSGWRQFTNLDMNISLIYPEQLKQNQISPELLALVEDPAHPDTQHVILIYVSRVSADSNDFDVNVPFDMPSQLVQSKQAQLNGFDTLLNTYSDGSNQVQLIMMKHGQQMITIRIPEHNTLKSEVLNKLLSSIRTLR